MSSETTDTEELEALIQFLYMAPIGLAQTSIDGEILIVNPISAQLLMPLTPDGSLSNLFTALQNVAPDLRHLVRDFGRPHGVVCDAQRIQLRSGNMAKAAPQVLSLSLVKLDESRLMAVISDISRQVERERLVARNEAWLNAILTGIVDYALISIDGTGRVDGWNDSIRRVLGFDRDAVVGQPYSIFYPGDAITEDGITDQLREADGSGWSLSQGWRVRADGSRFWGSSMIAPLRELVSTGNGALASQWGEESSYGLIIRDITSQREANEAYRQATHCDYLTGIANRRAFFEAAELELERRKRQPREVSLILFDVDYFKAVNDTYGHPAGDAALRQLANTLSATFRHVDVVARIGGEEFAALLPSTSLEHAFVVAERVRQSIQDQPVVVDHTSIPYTLSGGVAAMGESVKDLDELMKCADRALYAAKAAGRNRIECWRSVAEFSEPAVPVERGRRM